MRNGVPPDGRAGNPAHRWSKFWERRSHYPKQSIARIMRELQARAHLRVMVARWEAGRPPVPCLLADRVYGHLARARIGLGVTIQLQEAFGVPGKNGCGGRPATDQLAHA